MSIFGPLISVTKVENTVRDNLSSWLPTYLDEAARQDALAAIAHPKSVEVVRDRVTRWDEQAMPAVVIEVAGTLRVQRLGSQYRVVYGCTIGAIVGGQTRENTRQLAGVYGVAIAAALTQHGDLQGFADGCEWTDLDYSYIDESRSRTIMAAIVSLDVAVNQVLDVALGPSGPPPAPGVEIPGVPDYGDAATVDTQIKLTKIGDAL